MSPIRVLVADDHPTFRSGVRALLDTTPDIEVVGEAADGTEAIDLTREQRPDVVLLDLLMPEVGGVEACRTIVETTSSRVVVLTMSAADATVFASLRAGALGYLVKDARPDDILSAIRAVAAGHALVGGVAADRMAAFFSSPFADAVQPFPELSEREREVLDLLAQGQDNAGIARQLFLSPKTVRNYVSQITAKLRAHDRAEVIHKAREAGLGQMPL